MKISPDELDGQIQEWKRQGLIFLALDEVVDIMRSKRKPKHKFVSITLDDGYKDNVEYGYPIFKHHNVPFCIYITNSFPNQSSNLWWYALENVIVSNHVLNLPDGFLLQNRTRKAKEKNFLLLRTAILTKYFKDPISYLQQLGTFTLNLEEERTRLCLSWSQVHEISNDSLVTIGCHTLNHYPLSKLERSEAEIEIKSSKDELEQRLKKKIKHFAFPFGSRNEAGPREYEIAESIGFDSVVTTVHGNIQQSDDLQKLDRIFLSPLRGASAFRRQLFWDIKSAATTLKRIL